MEHVVQFDTNRRTSPRFDMLASYFAEMRKIRKKASTGAAWLSSARSVRSTLKWDNERNPCLVLNLSQDTAPTFRRGGRKGRRQVSMVLISWATHMLQCDEQRALPNGNVLANPTNHLSVGIEVCNPTS